MNKEPFPQRKSPRAPFHDYSGGDYFVTICTKEKKHYFGSIENASMQLSPIGEFVDKEINNLPTHYPYIEVISWVVMPNHIHAIIRIHHEHIRTKEIPDASRTHKQHISKKRTALSIVIGNLKRAASMFAQRNGLAFEWQKRYHDHIIRGVADGNRIADYISHNVEKWDDDCFY